MTNEIWKPIPNYEGLYECSNQGRVKSLARPGTKGTILRPRTTNTGYHSLMLCREGMRKTFKVHRLVALTFLSNGCNHPQVNHIDGNKINNNVENLEWCSPSHNVQHSFAMGLTVPAHGFNHYNAKLDEHDVIEIRKRLARGETNRSVGKIYGVKPSVISRIKTGKAWAHVSLSNINSILQSV